ncbi:hypothetical protein [Zooshikella sp. RANM57]|uniref:hypothetical protein n=1 Tax=Zooshikella sp. RANM57 TaxID=3425863 RepID=UPI003D6FC490
MLNKKKSSKQTCLLLFFFFGLPLIIGLSIWQLGSYGPFEIVLETDEPVEDVVIYLGYYHATDHGVGGSYSEKRIVKTGQKIHFPRGWVGRFWPDRPPVLTLSVYHPLLSTSSYGIEIPSNNHFIPFNFDPVKLYTVDDSVKAIYKQHFYENPDDYYDAVMKVDNVSLIEARKISWQEHYADYLYTHFIRINREYLENFTPGQMILQKYIPGIEKIWNDASLPMSITDARFAESYKRSIVNQIKVKHL